MSRPKLEVADVFRRHGAAWRAANDGHLSLGQRRVMTAIEICRTAALGGHVERCEDCAHTRIAYNSCRNRHCPKCQWRAAQAWLEAREAELLPVPYFHVVFTLPAAIGADRLPEQGQGLRPAVHGGGRDADHDRGRSQASRRRHRRHRRPAHLGPEPRSSPARPLHRARRRHLAGRRCAGFACRPGFFLPVRVLSRLFRRLFLQGLEALHRRGRAAVLQRSGAARGRRRVQGPSRAAAQAANGSSMPSGRSPAPSRFSPISRATRIASRSPTAG